ncbi:MAG: hemerythrin domain-containing protein [Candidatus Pacearchaeota archaeon]
MISLSFLKKEHKLIERELLELEDNMDSEEINLSNIKHTLMKLIKFWNRHEDKEDKLFSKFYKENPDFKYDKIKFEHKELNGIKKAILETLNSGSIIQMKASLDTDIRMLIRKLRDHMETEEEILKNLK